MRDDTSTSLGGLAVGIAVGLAGLWAFNQLAERFGGHTADPAIPADSHDASLNSAKLEGAATRFAIGMAAAAPFGWLRTRMQSLMAGRGGLFVALMWALQGELIARMTRRAGAGASGGRRPGPLRALASHMVFGLMVEGVARTVDRARRSASGPARRPLIAG